MKKSEGHGFGIEKQWSKISKIFIFKTFRTVQQVPLILNVETATEVCSVCISRGEEVLSLKTADRPNDHSKVITMLISECMEAATVTFKELDAVAVSAGPGSYTSLRVGASTAKGICFTQKIPLISISTLQALAHATFQEVRNERALYCPMIDARRMEVYCALFDSHTNSVTEARAMVIDGNSFQDYSGKNLEIVFSGNGMDKCRAILNFSGAIFCPMVCSAANLAPLSAIAFETKSFVNSAYFIPSYLKAPNITTSKQIFFK